MSNQIPVHNVTPPAKKPAESTDLYAAREKIYTRAFTGLFRNLRIGGGAVLVSSDEDWDGDENWGFPHLFEKGQP